MKLMLQSAAEMNVPAPVTGLSKQMLHAAIAQDYGEDDICGSIRVLEELAGCEVAPPGRLHPDESASVSQIIFRTP